MPLRTEYEKNVIPKLKKKFGYANNLAVPKLVKISVNVGLNKNSKDKEYKKYIRDSLKTITGQRPVTTNARNSIAGFNIREGLEVGVKVTLRGKRMYDFAEKTICTALPRVRDFQGISHKSIDKQGNLTIGFKEHIVFPEVNPEEISALHGLEVTIVTNAKTSEEALELFKLLKFPFKK